MNKPARHTRIPFFSQALLICSVMLLTQPLHAEEQYWIYTVRPGDTIWDLCKRHTHSVLNWKRIQRLNGIPDGPDRHVPPGTKLRFPLSLLKHQPASAQIVELQGEVSLIRARDGSSQRASSGMQLHSGDRLQSAADSGLIIRFADGSELRMSANSELVMDSLSAYGSTGMVDTRVRLQGGQIETQVRPLRGPGSRYEITTPAAVAAVRGTDFRISAEHAKPIARSEVLGGEVAVSAAGAQQRVAAGFGLVAEANTPPMPPKPLLPAPELPDSNRLQQRLPLYFTWQAIPQAQAYRFQIAPTAGFRQLLAEQITTEPRANWQTLPDGDYVLRVRAIDALGLEGLNATAPFTLAARPEPPLPIGLVNGAVIREAQPKFTWSQPQGAVNYRLQLASSEDFASLLLDETGLQTTHYVPATALAPGRYVWRLATIDASGKQGPYSDPQHFEYQAVPAAPELQTPRIEQQQLSFRWQAADVGQRYHFQLAEDPYFKEIYLERTTHEAGLTLPRPASRRYYFRVRALDASGYAGPFGQTQQIDVPPGSYWPLLIPLLLLFV